MNSEQSFQGKPLPQFVRDLLSAPPRRGEGLHNWLFRTARVLHAFRTREEIIETLRSATYGEPVPLKEIIEAVDNSAPVAWRPGEVSQKSRRWPAVNQEERAAIIAKSSGFPELFGARPFTDGTPHTEEIIDALFPGDPWLCCGATSRMFQTRLRSEWRGALAKLQLIVPSPMTEKFGLTKSGKKSQHTSSNTGPRRFLVVEQDRGSLDEQAAILAHLAKWAPLALVVHSGGKSLHGWFYCEGRSEEKLLSFMNDAVRLGADHTTWTRSQFVRMPDGTRDNGKHQSVYFFNPEVLKNER